MSHRDDLVEALRGARSSTFRLELQQDYPDDPQWQVFRAGARWEDNDDLVGWCDMVRSNVARGVTMQRVHVVTEPWTAYVRFEVHQHYPHNLRAGEEVRLLSVDVPWVGPDFWMVDGSRAWLLEYRADGAMIVVAAGADRLSALRDRRDRAVAESTPLVVPGGA